MEVEKVLKEIDELQEKIKDAQKSYVKVGVLGNSEERSDDSGRTNLEIANLHEFGGVNPDGSVVPARSFLRLTKAMKEKDFAAFVQANLTKFKLVVMTQGIEVALDEIGRYWVDEVLKTFQAQGYGEWAPLSPKTLELRREKGNETDTILTVTGALKRAITFEVVK